MSAVIKIKLVLMIGVILSTLCPQVGKINDQLIIITGIDAIEEASNEKIVNHV